MISVSYNTKPYSEPTLEIHRFDDLITAKNYYWKGWLLDQWEIFLKRSNFDTEIFLVLL